MGSAVQVREGGCRTQQTYAEGWAPPIFFPTKVSLKILFRDSSRAGSGRAPPILTQWRPTVWGTLKKPRTQMQQMPRLGGGVGQHSRGEGIQATGLHLQQTVLPVFLGHPEIVHGAPEDPESGVLQHEVLAIGLQP